MGGGVQVLAVAAWGESLAQAVEIFEGPAGEGDLVLLGLFSCRRVVGEVTGLILIRHGIRGLSLAQRWPILRCSLLPAPCTP